ncbi:MAG: nitroreductase family deazaflavin-dependent oxidoreductase [Nitrososphaerota archaeon]|nr:nitroreductase family deazaflavin-dependent oxidoreductase [Nitrososphaerota archaeon]
MWSRGQIIRLETVGRRTGRPHSVLVRYILFDGKVVIFPDPSVKQDWVANIQANPAVKLYADEGVFEGQATLRTVKSLSDPVLGIFQRKYGYQQVRQRYWGQRRYVEILLGGKKGDQRIDELIYGDLEVAFDSVAKDYDRHIFGNPMNRWLRDQSVSLMKSVFRPGDTVLEIGCGTGTETLSLASTGVRVIATDISSGMLEVLNRKAEAAGLSKLVSTVKCRASQVASKLTSLGITDLDGAYSTYGAINTEPNLKSLSKDLHGVLKEGSPLILGVWNKYCIYEIIGYTLRMKPAMAVARLLNPVPVGKSRFCVSSYSYSLGGIVELVRPFFKFERAYGVEILLPPSNLVKYLPPEPFLGTLKRIDSALGRITPFNRLGDHFLALFRRV